MRGDYRRHGGTLLSGSFISLCLYRYGRWGRDLRHPLARMLVSRTYGFANVFVANLTKIWIPPGATLGADFHIVYGPNEAGKSTLFSAWLDLLFGIPLRSRYDFLHPSPTMQIGARLTHANGTLELRRLKRQNASLLDGHDAPVPDSVLQSALGGLSRDSYSAMFSLDDDTLEKGGDSILSSRGDLG